jgi:RNA polymerase sigma factor (sigma-70 family)
MLMAAEKLSHLLLQHRSRIYGYLLTLVRDFDAAEDLFQNVALAVLEYEKADHPPIQNFFLWVREIARRRALAYFREKGGRLRPLTPEALEVIESVLNENGEQEDTLWGDAKKALRDCLGRLPANWVGWIRAHYGDQKTFEEIGRKIGRAASAVQVAFSRIRRKLAECVNRTLAERFQP